MSEKAKIAPMGWNSWDCYGAAVTEDIVRQNAKFMAENLKQYGWEYVVVDIQWYEPLATSHMYHPFTDLCMDEYSRLIPAPNRFPSSADGKGFGPLAEYVHSLGLKFGIHIMRGIPRQAVHQNAKILGTDKTAREVAKTASICVWNSDMYGVDPHREGARAYYDSIFKLYASWGVDFIKCDDIAREMPQCEEELVMLSEALKNCGREMVLSISPGPAPLDKAELFKQTCNMWRITDDFWDSWELLKAMFERCEVWQNHVGPGCWPDCDMLPLGKVGACFECYGTREHTTNLTKDEQRTMMNLWCIFRSPLMIGAELTKLDDFTRELLTNDEVLSLTKNEVQARLVSRSEESAIWATVSDDSTGTVDFYAALFNLSDESQSVSVKVEEVLKTLGLANSRGTDFTVRDLWLHKETVTIKSDGTLSEELGAHASVLFRVSE